jgi:ATP-binding cassette subfamily B protein
LGIKTVKLLGIEKFKFLQWKNKYKRTLNVVLESEKKGIMLHSLQRSLFYLSQIGVCWIGAYMTFNRNITIGQYLAFTAIFMIVMNSLDHLSLIWYNLTELHVSLGRLNDVLIQETEAPFALDNAQAFSADRILARNLSFKYNEKEEDHILKNINFYVQKGEHIGIVGRNGSGKTTLVKLLLNLYPDYKGEIFFDTHELRQLNIQVLRKKVFLFPQDIYVFAATIRENILYGNMNASMDDVIHASKLADLHMFIKTLHLGYNQKVGDTGGNLSGGQVLKIGFARLFLSNPDIIILDEASSMLDVEAEQKIMANIRQHFKGKTIITIAHRLHTLKNVDRIWVIDKGGIVEDGSHNELLEAKGLYHKFVHTYIDF